MPQEPISISPKRYVIKVAENCMERDELRLWADYAVIDFVTNLDCVRSVSKIYDFKGTQRVILDRRYCPTPQDALKVQQFIEQEIDRVFADQDIPASID